MVEADDVKVLAKADSLYFVAMIVQSSVASRRHGCRCSRTEVSDMVLARVKSEQYEQGGSTLKSEGC